MLFTRVRDFCMRGLVPRRTRRLQGVCGCVGVNLAVHRFSTANCCHFRGPAFVEKSFGEQSVVQSNSECITRPMVKLHLFKAVPKVGGVSFLGYYRPMCNSFCTPCGSVLPGVGLRMFPGFALPLARSSWFDIVTTRHSNVVHEGNGGETKCERGMTVSERTQMKTWASQCEYLRGTTHVEGIFMPRTHSSLLTS